MKARLGSATRRAAGLAALLVLWSWGGPDAGLAAEDGAARAAGSDPALLAIAEDICSELMGAERVRRQLNSYQLAALPHVAPDDGDGAARIGFFADRTFYCRRAGMALWATYDVARLPPQEILALQSPPAVALEIRFERVAPPATATEPDRLKAAAEAAKGALARVAAERGAVPGGGDQGGETGAQATAIRDPSGSGTAGGPQPIIPGSLDAVTGAGPARRPAAQPDAAGGQ